MFQELDDILAGGLTQEDEDDVLAELDAITRVKETGIIHAFMLLKIDYSDQMMIIIIVQWEWNHFNSWNQYIIIVCALLLYLAMAPYIYNVHLHIEWCFLSSFITNSHFYRKKTYTII